MSSNELLIALYKNINNYRIRKYLLIWITKSENGFPYSISARKLYSEYHGIKIGYGSYGGCFNIRNIPKGVSFGNYCSIAKNVKIFRANHPSNLFTTHPILYNPEMGYVKQDTLNRPPLIIGNDVWIGDNAIILPNVKIIGNGSIIGAGSIVTKDVDPYTIVAGNPAKLIKMRFPEATIKRLETSRWWNLNSEELAKQIDELNRMVDG